MVRYPYNLGPVIGYAGTTGGDMLQSWAPREVVLMAVVASSGHAVVLWVASSGGRVAVLLCMEATPHPARGEVVGLC